MVLSRPTLALTAFIAASAFGASPLHAAGGTADRAAEEQRIHQTIKDMNAAFAAGDAAKLAGFYTEDGQFMPPNAPAAQGREAIQAAWQSFLDLPNIRLEFGPTDLRVAESGDIGYDAGTYKVTFDGPQGTAEDEGKYVVVWRKIGDEWKAAYDIFNSDVPLPENTASAQ